jgi:hypothetical protein
VAFDLSYFNVPLSNPPFQFNACSYVQVLLQVLSNVESPDDLHSFFCTSRGALSMAADPVLMARWLAKHRLPNAVWLAARKGGADVMIHLLRMGALSATDRAPILTPIGIAVRENLPEVVTYLLSRNDVRAC